MNQLLSFFSLFGTLPRWLQTGIAALTALIHLGIGFTLGPMVALIFAIGLLLVIVLLGIYFYFLKQRRDRQRAALDGELGHNSLATPSAIIERQQLEKLGKIRSKFQEGLDKFRARGKDIYKLPWYVVIGESGAGKSEIIRRSDVGFPQDMQEEMQGVGGTINMDWWFTNHAVILDTAGRLLTDKVPVGASSEWKEFLKLLRKHRPNCPINGLLLTIPADSLIKDTARKVEERAGWIARQLDNIQRELDIRFPVYVLISKCDLMNGFREFFETTDDPDSQRQMLGWSNPDPLDTPFRPEIVDQHLHTVVERLRRARLPLIQEPVARDPSHRRIEEVDRLFAFPNSVSLIADNLRRYLSIIFVSGEWSAKPLFLRGIYFTSSLREGSELDQELAEAIGVSVDDLPEGRAWEKDRPFFLRDLFLEKMFREWGLVTRATDTRQLIRRRKLALLGAGFAALTALSLFSWLGSKSMHDSIGDQMIYWTRAAEGWSGDIWKPVVDPATGAYAGAEPVGRPQNTDYPFDGDQPLLTFHSELRNRAEEKLKIAPIFRIFNIVWSDFDGKRERAQRVVVENSVIQPLIEATRKKIIATKPGSPGSEPHRERAALLTLIKIESDIVKRLNKYPKIAEPHVVIGEPKTAIVPLLTFAVGEQKDFDDSILDVIAWTYTNDENKGKWPGKWLRGGTTLKSTKPEYNEAIAVGLEHFKENITLGRDAHQRRLEDLKRLKDFLHADYEKTEQALWNKAEIASGSLQSSRDELDTPYSLFMQQLVPRLKGMIIDGQKEKLFEHNVISLAAAYERILKEWSVYVTMNQNIIAETLKELDFKDTQVKSPLLPEIKAKLEQILTVIQDAPEKDPALLKELQRLDKSHLTITNSTRPAYEERLEGYATCIAISSETPRTDSALSYVGAAFKPIETIKLRIKLAGKKVWDYTGDDAPNFRKPCLYWLEIARRRQIDQYLTDYRTAARAALEEFLHFPLVWTPEEPSFLTPEKLKQALTSIETIREDLKAMTESDEVDALAQSTARSSLDTLAKNLGLLDPVFDALLDREKGRIRTFKISMKGVPEIRRAIEVGAVLDPLSKAPVAVADPDIFYLMRPGFYEPGHASKEKNLSAEVKVGVQAVIHEALPINLPFHFHTRPYKIPEPSFGPNWSVLRLLRQKNGVSQEGRRWEVNIGALKGGDYPLDKDCEVEIQFETSIPQFAQWPQRKLFDK